MFPYKLIDLTHTLDSSVPTWDGACGFNHTLCSAVPIDQSKNHFRVMQLSMLTGVGTHLDAPSHYFLNGKNVSDFHMNELIFQFVVIDILDQCHECYSLSIEDILCHEKTFGLIPTGSCVMVKTGWSRFWEKPFKYRNNHLFPSVSLEAAKLLLKRGISALGIDTLSPDRPQDEYKVHEIFLGAGKLLLENVANLNNMPPRDSFVLALPLKIRDGKEAPIRLVGLVKGVE
jgi:kynurenine formamidase